MVQGSEIQLRPTQARKDKIQGEVHRVQAQGTLSPAEASRLAGKMILLNATVFGRVGAAALRPLYVRAKAKGGRPKRRRICHHTRHRRGPQDYSAHTRPRRTPAHPSRPFYRATLDAFYKQGEQWHTERASTRLGLCCPHTRPDVLRTGIRAATTSPEVDHSQSLHILLGDLRTGHHGSCPCSDPPD